MKKETILVVDVLSSKKRERSMILDWKKC